MAEVAHPGEGCDHHAEPRTGGGMEEAPGTDRRRMGAVRAGRRQGAGDVPRRGGGGTGEEVAQLAATERWCCHLLHPSPAGGGWPSEARPGGVMANEISTAQGFRVLRFRNNEVDRNPDGVLTMVDHALHDPPPGRPPADHPPPSGEG